MNYTKKQATYRGQRVDRDSKALYAWHWHDEADEALHLKQLVSSAPVGGIYEFTVTEDLRVFTKGENAPRLLRMSDDPKVPIWRTQSQDAQVRIQAKREEKKLAKSNSDIGDMTLSQVRDLMRLRGSTVSRSGLLATVLAYIQA